MLVGRLDISLIRLLGQGSYGDVYLASGKGDGGFERHMAVKRLRPDISRDPEIIRGFVKEARICGLLNHPNIIQVYGFTQTEDGYILLMEYLDGVELRSLIRRLSAHGRMLPPALAAEIVRQLCQGLDCAHDATRADGQPLSIIHRDIKPTNLMLTVGGIVKIMDFGVARGDAGATVGQTGDDVVKGTMRYMAPEQLAGLTLSPACDQFAAGLILGELLLNRPIYGAPDIGSLILQVQAGDVSAALARIQEACPPLAHIFARATARSPEDRYPSAGKMASDLLRAQSELPRPGTSLGTLVKEIRAERQAESLTAEQRREREGARRDADLSNLTVDLTMFEASLELEQSHRGEIPPVGGPSPAPGGDNPHSSEHTPDEPEGPIAPPDLAENIPQRHSPSDAHDLPPLRREARRSGSHAGTRESTGSDSDASPPSEGARRSGHAPVTPPPGRRGRLSPYAPLLGGLLLLGLLAVGLQLSGLLEAPASSSVDAGEGQDGGMEPLPPAESPASAALPRPGPAPGTALSVDPTPKETITPSPARAPIIPPDPHPSDHEIKPAGIPAHERPPPAPPPTSRPAAPARSATAVSPSVQEDVKSWPRLRVICYPQEVPSEVSTDGERWHKTSTGKGTLSETPITPGRHAISCRYEGGAVVPLGEIWLTPGETWACRGDQRYPEEGKCKTF